MFEESVFESVRNKKLGYQIETAFSSILKMLRQIIFKNLPSAASETLSKIIK